MRALFRLKPANHGTPPHRLQALFRRLSPVSSFTYGFFVAVGIRPSNLQFKTKRRKTKAQNEHPQSHDLNGTINLG